MAITVIFPQYAYNLMRNVHQNKNKDTVSKPSIVSFRNLYTTLHPIYKHLVVDNTKAHLRRKNIEVLHGMSTDINVQPTLCNNIMFNKNLNIRKRISVVEATNSSKNHDNHENISTCKKCIEYHNMQIIVIAITTLIMSTTNKILYKMALVPMKNYPFFLAQILTFGYVIVYSSILLYRYKNGLVTREMLKMPKKPFIAIGFLEALGLAIGMAAAINLPGA